MRYGGPCQPTRSSAPCPAPAAQCVARVQKMREIYKHELLSRMGRPHRDSKPVDWIDFLKYVNEKEVGLWRIFHHELNLVSPLPPIYTPLFPHVS